MGYQWVKATDDLWRVRDKRGVIWQVSYEDNIPWTLANLTDGFVIVENLYVDVQAVFMHPTTWATFKAQVPVVPGVFVKETNALVMATGRVGTIQRSALPVRDLGIPRRPLPPPAVIYVGWRIPRDRVWILGVVSPGRTTRVSAMVRVLHAPRLGEVES